MGGPGRPKSDQASAGKQMYSLPPDIRSLVKTVKGLHPGGRFDIFHAMVAAQSVRNAPLCMRGEEEIQNCQRAVVAVDTQSCDDARFAVDEQVENHLPADEV